VLRVIRLIIFCINSVYFIVYCKYVVNTIIEILKRPPESHLLHMYEVNVAMWCARDAKQN
jgi:hypothetical protein